MRAALICAAAIALAAVPARVDIASAGPVALHTGDSVTLSDLYGYLAALPQPGDWVTVSNTGGGVSSVVTTGFGAEDVAGTRTLWIETSVKTLPVSGLGLMQSGDFAAPVILKTYVTGVAFGPFGAKYGVIASVASIGDKAFRLSDRFAGYPTRASGSEAPTFSLADGTPFAQSAGAVEAVEPKDMEVAGAAIHATHIVVSFAGESVAQGAAVPPSVVEVWQSPDVPLGTVASHVRYIGVDRSTALVAFGRGDYRSLITTSLDELRAQAAGGS